MIPAFRKFRCYIDGTLCIACRTSGTICSGAPVIYQSANGQSSGYRAWTGTAGSGIDEDETGEAQQLIAGGEEFVENWCRRLMYWCDDIYCIYNWTR